MLLPSWVMLNKISENIIIRRMQEVDLDIVTNIENSIATTPWDMDQFLGCCRVYDAFVVVVNSNDNQIDSIDIINNAGIVGYGIIAIYESINQAQILNIGVAKCWQRLGIAKILLKYLIELFIKNSNYNNLKANCNNTKEIFLEVNENNQAAISLYKQFNFIQVGFRNGYYQTKNGKENALVFLLEVVSKKDEQQVKQM
jgi:[ribosomal protein S18]-alanine N-acetyltransferase